jgi:hypothetical protein
VAGGSRRRDVIGPALILAILVGVFHSALFVLIRGSAGGQLPLLVLAATLAWESTCSASATSGS